MPRFRHLLALLTLVTSASVAAAQGSSASDAPRHLAKFRFEFVTSGESLPPGQPKLPKTA